MTVQEFIVIDKIVLEVSKILRAGIFYSAPTGSYVVYANLIGTIGDRCARVIVYEGKFSECKKVLSEIAVAVYARDAYEEDHE